MATVDGSSNGSAGGGGGLGELGELLDAHERTHADPTADDGGGEQQDGPRPRGRPGRGPGFEALASPNEGRPVAATLRAASELLNVPLPRVRQAAAAVEPYVHANGSLRWSLMLLERELGQRRTGPGSAWRGRSIRQG